MAQLDIIEAVDPSLAFAEASLEEHGGEDLLDAVGHTPLVRLRHLFAGHPFDAYVKVEGCNLGGSLKDRAAFSMIRGAIARGKIGPETTVIESSSGNMAIGLAQACNHFGLRLICVVDSRTTRQNVAILSAYGAQIDLVSEPDPATGDLLQARLDRIAELQWELPDVYWTHQYSNIDNPRAHHRTAEEIAAAATGPPDYLFVATGTCGTIRGIADYFAQHRLPTRIIAVDAVGSVIFGGERCQRLVPGHGSAIRSELFRPGMAERCVHVDDLDCVVGCRKLAYQEGILAGGSSGAVIRAMEKFAADVPAGSVCVAILSDRGERYLDTIYDDAWVAEHFGDVQRLWQGAAADRRRLSWRRNGRRSRVRC